MTQRTMLAAVVGVLVLCVCLVQAEIFFHEEFNTLDGWVQSEHKDDYGKVELSAGALHVDAAKEQGMKLTEDSKFYAISKELPTPVSNDGKPLVISFSVKNEQNLKCGGAYLKFFSELNQKDLHSESPYWLMFGPDVCGFQNRLHFIFNYNDENHLWRSFWRLTKELNEKATHVYTVQISPNNTYQLYVDGKYIQEGSLVDEWEMLPPKTIADPEEKKPSNWIEDSMMDDPYDTKPEDWDDELPTIADDTAVKPDDWVDEEDGEWEAPRIPNPKYRGAWVPRRIDNPNYKGVWSPQQIPNPDYKEDPNLYKSPAPLKYVGIDVWQVESGSIFDNIIIGDDLQEVLKVVESTYGAMAEDEMNLIEAEAEERQRKERKQEEENSLTEQEKENSVTEHVEEETEAPVALNGANDNEGNQDSNNEDL
ncbi:putative calreticulin [Leishmania braziliensis MHOM/BR/75/M2904]|uniref:Calreticulin n=2 Tax=Leishmania braziliensis TaxID=5660 RepID=A4HJP8_LEIBR|nr:putative calreticulin [Leishmania braziliensis MHOM/BR/75/M2904]CAM42714.2 putative calreticulin [Leishmania braziliensis MHOM/BR/75/M2904]